MTSFGDKSVPGGLIVEIPGDELMLSHSCNVQAAQNGLLASFRAFHLSQLHDEQILQAPADQVS